MAIESLLHLFVFDVEQERSRVAIAAARVVQDHVGQGCELVIVDVLKQPKLAESASVRVTPTLIRVAPLPSRRVVGDLSSLAAVVEALNLALPRTNGSYEQHTIL